jgi:NAD(P)-dependent dehydrogenase (short-subunit alcohol dehydrogenase family)
VARRADALASVVVDISKSGGRAQGVLLDVTLADKIDGAMKEAEAAFGAIHAVVNNASPRPDLRSIKTSATGTASSIPTSRESGWSRRRPLGG